MSLEYAILGFLQYMPLSGYDLKSVFDISVQHFWSADQSQIYRTLSRLAEQGLVEIEVIEQDDRPDRKVYHITDKGHEELIHWLAEPLPTKSERIAELIQIFFAAHLSDDEILELFRQKAKRIREKHDALKNMSEQNTCQTPKDAKQRDAFFWRLTLEYGIRMTEACALWFDDVVTRLEQGEHLREIQNENTSG
jgi:DNA-binding PadR family transcriptional regulator